MHAHGGGSFHGICSALEGLQILDFIIFGSQCIDLVLGVPELVHGLIGLLSDPVPVAVQVLLLKLPLGVLRDGVKVVADLRGV